MKKWLLLLIFSVLFPTLAWAQMKDDPNCQGAWLFTEGSGTTVADSSQNANTLTFKAAANDPSWSADVPAVYAAGSTYYDGDDAASVADHASLDFAGAFSIVSWAKRETGEYILQRYNSDGYRLRRNASNLWNLAVWVDTLGDDAVSDNTTGADWTHICGVRQADGTLLLYIGGVLQVDTGTISGAIDVAAKLWFGANFTGGSNYFTGYISESGLFDDVLTPTEINDIKDNGLAGGAPPVGAQPYVPAFAQGFGSGLQGGY